MSVNVKANSTTYELATKSEVNSSLSTYIKKTDMTFNRITKSNMGLASGTEYTVLEYTLPSTGYYVMSANCVIQSTATSGIAQMYMNRVSSSGSYILGQCIDTWQMSGQWPRLSGCAPFYVNKGDKLRVNVIQSGGYSEVASGLEAFILKLQ